MATIKLLDKSVYELIAAGEVIERPSSVIKELVENAIDAGATRIAVEIKNGGISYMRVTDNGCGMAYGEVPTAFLRHATSKLSTAEELENIHTLGFRGEALASVSAVARAEVLTKRPDDNLGTAYKISGGEEELHEQTGCPDGTTIILRDLFYNTPARLKFLKKDVTEGNYVQSVVDRLALAHPEIAFSFIRDNKTVRVTSGDGKLYSVIYSVFGRQFAASLTEVDYEQYGVHVSGYISVPHACRANRQMQYFFINRRSVRNTTCMAALEEAYKNSVMVGKFPACVLSAEMSPSEVDVNVSPSKTEVRFANDRIIFETVYLAVKNGILNAENSREMALKIFTPPQSAAEASLHEPPTQNKTKASVLSQAEPKTVPSAPTEEKEPHFPPAQYEYRSEKTVSLSSSAAVYKPLPPKNIFIQEKIDIETSAADTSSYEFIDSSSLIRNVRCEDKNTRLPDLIVEAEYSPDLKFIGELFKTYIVCECGDELLLIDKHAAHERIRFEQLKKELVSSAQLLTESAPLTLSPEEWTALADNADYLEHLGIELTFDNDFKADITAFPSLLTDVSPVDTLQKIAEILMAGGDDIEGELFDDILHIAACKGAIKAHEYTSAKELEILARRVWDDKSIRYCPHGRPIITTISKYSIEKNFGRIQG